MVGNDAMRGSADAGFWVRVPPEAPGYPWEVNALHPTNFPTPGLWFDADEASPWFDVDDKTDGLVRAALLSALAMAELDPDYAHSRQSGARRLRQQMRAHLLCDYNLEAYGASNENICGGNHPGKPHARGGGLVRHVMADTGLGVNWEPRHADNRMLIASERPPQRVTSRAGDPSPGATGSARPLLWLPPVDLAALRREGRITAGALRWSDGSSVLRPPPPVGGRGIQNPYALPGMPGYRELAT